MAGTTYAFLVGVEEYQEAATILGVPFAIADAQGMRRVLIDQFQVPAQNITVWVNQDVTRSRLENTLNYEIKQLGPEDQFIFFYAGHGFHAEGTNRLTAWDTNPFNLFGTTVCIETALLSPLKTSHCRKSLVFIDACATPLADNLGRNVLAGMKPEEFANFVQSSEYRAAFFACSQAQQSYSWPGVKHGIWTYHLLRGLRGEDERAFARERRITGNSLQTYLAVSVPEFIRQQTDLKVEQRPYAELATHGDFEIINVPVNIPPTQEPPPEPSTVAFPDAVATARYIDQRRPLPEDPLITKIAPLPHCKIWARPSAFRKARFQNVERVSHFVSNATVHSAGHWSQYPWCSTTPERGEESIFCGIELNDDAVKHFEHWRLFQSAQFVHYLALDQNRFLGTRTHVFEILDTVTAVFEFLGRMADRNVLTDPIAITIDYKNVDGWQLRGQRTIATWQITWATTHGAKTIVSASNTPIPPPQ